MGCLSSRMVPALLEAKWQSRQAGTWGVMGCFSFHPRKAITTGEGGMIITDDGKLARRLRSLRNHGQDPDADSTDFIMPGFNYRMTEFQASLGSNQLTKLDRVITARRRLATHYDQLLAGTSVKSPMVPPESWPVYQSYVVLLPELQPRSRAELIQLTKESRTWKRISGRGTCR